MKDEERICILKKVRDNTLAAVNKGIEGPVGFNEAVQFSRMRGLNSIYHNTLALVTGTVNYEGF